jgi:P27 family predicted phage terminase small subunit
MGARGPAKKPAHLKLLEGRSTGRDSGGRPVSDGPKFRRGAPDQPTWLTALAAEEWDRVVPTLVKLNVLKPGDASVLAIYCESVAEYRLATHAIEEHGSLFFEAKQGLIPHPAVSVRRNAGARAQALAKEFGLTPSSEQDLARGDGGGGSDDIPY